MKTALKLSGALLFLSIAAQVGCGGDDLFGTTCPSSGAALTSGAVNYTVVASQIADTCNNPPISAAELGGTYSINTDSSCAVTIKGKSGLEIGAGTATQSPFQLTYTEVVSEAASGGNCQYNLTINSTATVTDAKTVTLEYNETDGDYMNLAGKTCIPPSGGSCIIGYTLVMTKQ